MIQPLWKTVWKFLKKLEIKPTYDPEIPLLSIYPEETKIERDTCIPLFIAALFTIARTWKQPKCPSADEWIKKLWTAAFQAPLSMGFSRHEYWSGVPYVLEYGIYLSLSDSLHSVS